MTPLERDGAPRCPVVVSAPGADDSQHGGMGVTKQGGSMGGAESSSRWRIQVYTGDGKGKTTCAVGLAIRALGAGFKVAMVQFDKGYHGEEHYGERRILRTLEGFDLFPTGCERMMPGGKFRFGMSPEDVAEGQRGLAIARELIAKPRHRLLVLDEILSAVPFHLLEEKQVLDLLNRYEHAGRPFELVMTGRRAPASILDRADLITEMTPVRHYFDTGLMARAGIEF